MRSSFGSKRRPIVASAKPSIDEVYDMKGLNMIAPDQVMPKGESPYTINSRMYSREDNNVRVAIETRKGPITNSTPVGQTLNVQDVATVTVDLNFTPAIWRARPFTPSSTGALTQLDLYVRNSNGASGPVIVEIWTNVSGAPGALIAQSSPNSSSMLGTFQYLPVYFIDAPTLTNATQYWIVVHTQIEGQGSYYLGQTAASGGLTSTTGTGTAWVTGPTFRYKSYISTSGLIKGFTRRSPSSKEYRNIFALGTNLYSVPDNPAIPVVIDSDIGTNSTKVRFDQVNDLTFYADGVKPAKQWDGTNAPTAVANLTGTPSNVIVHKNRLFVLKDGLRAEFSDLFDFTVWPSVNFFYVGSPKSPDPVTGWVVFQDNLVIFTKATKYILSGGDLSSFTIKQAVGTKGAVSQEVLAVDRNYIWFLSPDGTINRFNGISDELMSDKIQPELSTIQDLETASIAIHNNLVRLYYSKSPNTQVNRSVVYDTVYEQWFLDTGKPIMGALSVVISNRPLLLEFSSLAGWILYGDKAESDLGKAIDFKYWTPYKAYNSGASKKRIKRFRPILRASRSRYSMKVGIDFNFTNKPKMNDYLVSGEGPTWGGGGTWGGGTTWGSTSLVDNATQASGRAEHIQYRFEKKGVDTPIEIYGYIILLKEGRPR